MGCRTPLPTSARACLNATGLAVALAACGQLLELPERTAVANVAECSPDAGCSCAPGFADCDGLLENGCEVDLVSGERCACEPKLWPQAPSVGDASSEPTLLLAVRSCEMLRDGRPVGYDLDQHCTCSDEQNSPCPCSQHCDCEQVPTAQTCLPPTGTRPYCDGPGGVDNATLQLIKLAAGFAQWNVMTWNEAIERGDWTIFVSVTNYNRQPNDSKVEVAFLFGAEFKGDPCNSVDAKPKWDGTDRWPVRADGFDGVPEPVTQEVCGQTLGLSVEKPLYVDRNAYVVDGTLVAQWPEAVELNLSGTEAGLRLELVQSVLTARIAQDGPVRPGEGEPTWRLHDAVLGGRWSERAIFSAIGGLRKKGTELLCNDKASMLFAKSQVCPLLDVRIVAGGPTSTCDAISFGFGFEAQQAELGSFRLPVKVDDCVGGLLDEIRCTAD